MHVCNQDTKQQQECALANRAALVKMGALDALLTLAVGGGGLPSGPVRTQVTAIACLHIDKHSLHAVHATIFHVPYFCTFKEGGPVSWHSACMLILGLAI
jgi:hypothetical protein